MDPICCGIGLTRTGPRRPARRLLGDRGQRSAAPAAEVKSEEDTANGEDGKVEEQGAVHGEANHLPEIV
jgi:hypothetical protein